MVCHFLVGQSDLNFIETYIQDDLDSFGLFFFLISFFLFEPWNICVWWSIFCDFSFETRYIHYFNHSSFSQYFSVMTSLQFGWFHTNKKRSAMKNVKTIIILRTIVRRRNMCVPYSKSLLNFAIFSQTFHGFDDRSPNKSIISACAPP